MPSLYCSLGKVSVPPLLQPPEPLKTLLHGQSENSRHFLSNVRKYNSCFQMTSFAGKTVGQDSFMPISKVQGQIYHLAGPLHPHRNEEPKFFSNLFHVILLSGNKSACLQFQNSKRKIVHPR